MKNQASVIFGYAGLLLVGGIIGFVQAGSLASLVMSGAFAIVLFVFAYQINKNKNTLYIPALLTVSFLLAFFLYRFSLSYKFVPSGLMGFVTFMVLSYLFFKRPKK